jgi:TolB-like protein/Tfp pilus assembly protein PilF
MSEPSFLAELKRRNVIRAAGLYLVGAWLVVQVSSTVLPLFGAPQWITRSVVILLAVGFVPAMIFSWIFELTPEGLKRDDEVPAEESTAPDTARKMDRMIIAVLALALLYFGFDKFVLAPQRDAALVATAQQQAGTKSAVASASGDKSIAVLPLANESGEKDQQYFSDGLSEDLITALSQFSGLKVISRNSSFQFRDSKDDSRTIGSKLGVAHLLEGSVRRAGDDVRISAELVNATDGSTLWSEHYDRPYKDLFKLQDDITNTVAGELKTRLLSAPGAAVQSDRPPSGNLDAYNAYLQGKYHFQRTTEADFREAIAQYTRATQLDPRYAAAEAELSHAYSQLASAYMGGAAAQVAYAQARAAANNALALDPKLALAHIARGWLLFLADFNWSDAEAEYRLAVQLAPADGQALFGLGNVLATRGQLQKGIALVQQALATDPRNNAWDFWLSNFLLSLGRSDEAEQAIRKAIELQPTGGAAHEQLAAMEALRGNAAAALEAAQQEPPGLWQDIALAMARQVGPDRAAADAALKDLIAKDSEGSAYQIAEVYALRNDPDQTFAWLDRAWAVRDTGIHRLLYDPFIVRYRDDPRFAAFCRKIGLPTPAELDAASVASPDSASGKSFGTAPGSAP